MRGSGGEVERLVGFVVEVGVGGGVVVAGGGGSGAGGGGGG